MKNQTKLMRSFVLTTLTLVILAGCELTGEYPTNSVPLPKPPTPANLTATYVSEWGWVELTFRDSAVHDTYYDFELQTDSLSWEAVSSYYYEYSDTTILTMQDLHCRFNQINQYRVRAHSYGSVYNGYSDWSEEVEVSVGAPPIPATPTGLTCVYNADSLAVKLMWHNNGILPIDSRIERRTDSNEWVELDYLAYSWVDSSVQYGYDRLCIFNKVNYYRVKITKKWRFWSEWSEIVGVETGPPPPIPAAPSGMLIGYVDSTSYSTTLHWVDNSDNEAGFVIEDSIAQHGDAITSGWEKLYYLSPNDTSALVSNYNYSPAATFFYRVRAVNRGGESDCSNVRSCVLKYTYVDDGGGYGGGWGGCGIVMSDPSLPGGDGKKGDENFEIAMWSTHNDYLHINDSHRLATRNINSAEDEVFVMNGRGECYEEMIVHRALIGDRLRLDMRVRTIPVAGQDLDHELGIGFVNSGLDAWGKSFAAGKIACPELNRVRLPFGNKMKLKFYKWYDVVIEVDLKAQTYDLSVERILLAIDVPLQTMVFIPCLLGE